MVVIATFVTMNFREWRRSWHGHPLLPRAGLALGPAVERTNKGILAAIDYESGEVVFTKTLDTPSGFSYDASRLYVNSMYGNRVLILDQHLNVIDSLSVPLMNDLHSLRISPAGLLITSSGTDAIMEMSRNGELIWEWLATEHGFDRLPAGEQRQVLRDRDYRSSQIDTLLQTTHCNSALPHVIEGRDVIVGTLFHQGQVVGIDRITGMSQVLVDGMLCPHSIRRLPAGWLVSDSRSGTVSLLDEAFRRTSVIVGDFRWVQDALMVGPNTLLIADANNTRLVEWDIKNARPSRSITYPDDWKLYQLETASEDWELCFRSAGARRHRRRPTRSRSFVAESSFGKDGADGG